MKRLGSPADPLWIAQRVVSLLTHYFVAEAHPGALENVARDWKLELAEFPEWAIEDACRWWVGRENKRRRSKPLPGDIAERANRAMACVHSGRAMVECYDKYGDAPPAFLLKN